MFDEPQSNCDCDTTLLIRTKLPLQQNSVSETLKVVAYMHPSASGFRMVKIKK